MLDTFKTKIEPRLSGLRRNVYALELLLERRRLLFVVADVILVFQGLMAALLGDARLESLYRSMVVAPVLVLGVAAAASAVALERRAGSLDLALSVPSTERYFVRRVAPVAGFLLVQAWLLLFVAYLIVHEEKLFDHLLSAKGLFALPAMLHTALTALLTGTVTLFWAARTRTAGGAMAASFLTLFALSKWIFANPFLEGLGPSGTWLFGVPPVLFELGWNLGVLGIAAVLFFLYARERLRRPETLLAGLLALAGACAEVPEPPARPAKVPVRSEVVAAAPFRPVLSLYGKVEPAARLEVRPLEGGTITWAPRFAGGLRTGERVRRGETLFTIVNEDLELARTEAELEVRSAQSELGRAKLGVEGGFLPEAELRRAEIAAELARERLASLGRRLERLSWIVPRAGSLSLDRVVPPGSQIAPGALLAEIAGEGRLRVEAWATAVDLGRLEVGLEVDCRGPGSDAVAGRGALAEIAREVDRGGAVRLVVTIEEDLGMPPVGEGVELDVHLAERAAALTLPEEAVIVDGGVASVFVLEPSGASYKARLRPVRPGSRSAGRVEILDGLRDGERVAVEGTELLADGLLAVEADGAG